MEYKRICPKCKEEIIYSNKGNFDRASKNRSSCRSCNGKRAGEEVRINCERGTHKINTKSWSEIWKEKYGEKDAAKMKEEVYKNRDKSYIDDEYRKKASKSSKGKNNGMFGKTFYDIWKEKYGEKIANEKLAKIKERHKSGIHNGEKNGRFGKPPSLNFGSGWAGWYNGIHFRSLLELSFIYRIEKFGFKWKTAEIQKYTVKYFHEGKQKTYRPDFMVNEKYLIEIKPKIFWNSEKMIKKKEAIEILCQENKWKYKIIEPSRIKKEILKSLYENNELKMVEKIKKKFLKLIY